MDRILFSYKKISNNEFGIIVKDSSNKSVQFLIVPTEKQARLYVSGFNETEDAVEEILKGIK